MLRIEINTDEGSSLTSEGNGFEYLNDCANAIMAMCDSLTRRIGGDKEKGAELMGIVFNDALKAYHDDDQTVKLVKQTTVRTLGELLAEDTE